MSEPTPHRQIIRRRRGDGRASRPLKIVVTGPFAAGKTSLIQAISEVAVVGTEREISDHTRERSEGSARRASPLSEGSARRASPLSEGSARRASPLSEGSARRASPLKETTTVAMDFGRVSLGNGLSLLLFGTPGQRRFEVMWEVLSDGMIGFILLVNGSDERSIEAAVRQLETFRAYADVPFVVGVSHLDLAGVHENHALAAVRERLGLDEEADVVACDPRDREDVKAMMLRILFGVLRRLEQVERVAATS